MPQSRGQAPPPEDSAGRANGSAPPPTPLADAVATEQIDFGRGRRSTAALAPSGTNPAAIVEALKLTSQRAVILVCGTTAGLADERVVLLRELFRRGLAPAARDVPATVLDGIADARGIALIGDALADDVDTPRLIGVSPTQAMNWPTTQPPPPDLIPPDANHSSFILVDGQGWSDATSTMFAFADALSANGRVVTVLIGGDDVARGAVLRSIRRNWPVLVVQGTGGFSDQLAQALDKPAACVDPVLQGIVNDGRFEIQRLDAEIARFEKLLAKLLSDTTALHECWERFAHFNHNAVAAQTGFKLLQNWILGLGVVGTFLALSDAQWHSVLQGVQLLPGAANNPAGFTLADLLRDLIILVPIAISILVAILGRTKIATRWVLLRGVAEAIKREIFRYRARAGIYSDAQTNETSRESRLAEQVALLTERVMRSEVNTAGLARYRGDIPPKMDFDGGKDDGLTFLSPEKYVAIRVNSQINYYRGKTQRMGREIERWQWLILLAGGVGALLAAVQLQLWVALATALVIAFTAYLQYLQLEHTLVKYNQGEASLANIARWWAALAPSERADPRNYDKLVQATEETLEAETTGWVHQMSEALAKLDTDQRGQHGAAETSDAHAPDASHSAAPSRSRSFSER